VVIAPIVALAVLMGVLPNLFLRPMEDRSNVREPGAQQRRSIRAN
jgi:hypothetical protein